MSAPIDSHDAQVTAGRVACAVCGLEIPPDEAVVPEATDQLVSLCGVECYARWRETAAGAYPSLEPR